MQDEMTERRVCVLWNQIWIKNWVMAINEGIREIRDLGKFL